MKGIGPFSTRQEAEAAEKAVAEAVERRGHRVFWGRNAVAESVRPVASVASVDLPDERGTVAVIQVANTRKRPTKFLKRCRRTKRRFAALRAVVERRESRNGERTIRHDEATGFEALQHIRQSSSMQPVKIAASLSGAITSVKKYRNAVAWNLERQSKRFVAFSLAQVHGDDVATDPAFKAPDLHFRGLPSEGMTFQSIRFNQDH